MKEPVKVGDLCVRAITGKVQKPVIKKQVNIVDLENLPYFVLENLPDTNQHLYIFGNTHSEPDWTDRQTVGHSYARVFKYFKLLIPRWSFNTTEGRMKEYVDKKIHKFIGEINKTMTNEVPFIVHSKDVGFLTLMEEYPLRTFKFPEIVIQPTTKSKSIENWIFNNQQKIKKSSDVLELISSTVLSGLTDKELGILMMLKGIRRPGLGSKVIDLATYESPNRGMRLPCLISYVKLGYTLINNSCSEETILSIKPTTSAIRNDGFEMFRNEKLIQALKQPFLKFVNSTPSSLKELLKYSSKQEKEVILSIKPEISYSNWFVHSFIIRDLTKLVLKKPYISFSNFEKLLSDTSLSITPKRAYIVLLLRGIIR